MKNIFLINQSTIFTLKLLQIFFFKFSGKNIHNSFESKLNNCRNYAAGADIARLLILYIYVGMYSDFDNNFKKKLGTIKVKEKHTKNYDGSGKEKKS
jgi:Glycosyltransferase sugar-binding region containing DXD motif